MTAVRSLVLTFKMSDGTEGLKKQKIAIFKYSHKAPELYRGINSRAVTEQGCLQLHYSVL